MRTNARLVSLPWMTLLVYVLLLHPLSAQQVPTDPTSTHIFPAGGRRGTTVSVRVGGECVPSVARFIMYGEGFETPELLGGRLASRGEISPRRKPGEVPIYYPKEWDHRIEIAATAKPETYYWRLASARGGTGARPFIVGELPEHIEQESNSTPDRAELVNWPCTLNGQIEGERDLDYFAFDLNKDTSLTIEVVSRRLGSPLEPLVEVLDDAGQSVECLRYKSGSDPVIAFRSPRTGRYRLMIGHLGFQGGPQFVYRINLSPKPFAPVVFPPAVQAGNSQAVRAWRLSDLLGNAANGDSLGESSLSPWMLPIESVRNLPNTLEWIQVKDAANAIPVIVESGAVKVESEPNDSPQSPHRLDSGGILYGQLQTKDDVDHFVFRSEKDVFWTLDCRSVPRGSDCLPSIAVSDTDGLILAQASCVDDPFRRCQIRWRAPATGQYIIRINDLQKGVRGGVDFVYRLELNPSTSGFELVAAQDIVNVVQGAKAELEIKVRRAGDFNQPIDLLVDGLPAGVELEPKQIPAGQETVKLTWIASEDSPTAGTTIRIRGECKHDGQSLSSLLRAQHLGRDSDGASVGDDTIDHLLLNVRHKPVVRLFCSEAYQYAYRGTIYPYAMEIERLNGFDGPVTIEVADRQIKDLDGIEVLPTTIPAGQTQFSLPIYLPESMHINVQAHSNVYAQVNAVFTDRYGKRQSQSIISEMRCMIRPLPTVVKLVAVDDRTFGNPGDQIRCRLRLDRTSQYGHPMKVELTPECTAKGLYAEAITLDDPRWEGHVDVRLPSNLDLASPFPIRFRATGKLPGYISVISEATVWVGGNHNTP